MFFLTGAIVLFGSFVPNQTPRPALAFVFLLRLQDLSVKAMMSGGFCILGSHLTDSSFCFLGFVKIQKFLWIVPVEVMQGSKILTSPGGPMPCLSTAE